MEKDLERNDASRQRSTAKPERRPHLRSNASKRDDGRGGDEQATSPGRSKPGFGAWFVQRTRYFSWTWFTLPMATGGLANVIYNIPFRFKGLYAIGCVFFFLALIMFIYDVVMITCRAVFFFRGFRKSFFDSNESLFVPASFVSFGTLLINISQYGLGNAGPWLDDAARVLFWIDCCLAVIASIGIYLTLWSTQTFTVDRMTPIWIFPAYPLLLIGPFAAVLSASIEPSRALEIIVGGVVLQGIGFMLSIMIYSAYIYRLMTHKLPRESARPGMFVSVGPSGFTIAGIVGMAANIDRALSPDFMGDGRLAAFVLKIVGNWLGMWLWGLALWFFFISVFAHYSCVRPGRFHFDLTWFSFVFPNTALITATLAVGKAFGSQPIQIAGTAMAIVLVVVWVLVMIMMIRALYFKQLLWPKKDDDEVVDGSLRMPEDGANEHEKHGEKDDEEYGELPTR